MRELPGHDDSVEAIAITRDDRTFITVSDDETARIWDLRRLDREPVVIRGRGELETIDLSPDGRLIAYGGDAGQTIVEPWRTSALAELVCRRTWRDLGADEWSRFVGDDQPRHRVC